MKSYVHLASRIFETPLAIREGKLVDITGYLVPRFRGDSPGESIDMEPITREPMDIEAGIATIDICGTLVDKAGGMDAMSGLTSYESIQDDFQSALNDNSVRGILLDIDSPGGEVGGMYDLSDLIYKARGVKPIYASCSWCASAAYILASAADRIFVRRTSNIGSIGIIALHLDQSGFDAQQGFKFTYVYAGSHKKDGNQHEPLNAGAMSELQGKVDRLYDMFVATVARNRGVSAKAIQDTEAAIYMGEAGISSGLADAMGTRDEAMQTLSVAASKPKVSVVTARASSARAAIQNNRRIMADLNEVEAQAEALPPSAAQPPAIAAPAVPPTTIAIVPPVAQPSTVDVAAITSAARTEVRASFVAMLETCAIGGLTARAALKHINAPNATLESVRSAVLAARAENAGPEISSHIAPDAGTDVKAKPEDSPVVKAAEKRAAQFAAQGRK